MNVWRRFVFAICCCLLVGLLGSVADGQPPGDWHVETIDTGHGASVGTWNSLAIDRSGNLHLAYSNSKGNVLRYAYRAKQEERWYSMTVDVDAGSFASLAVDSHGRPHIAYNSPYETGLHYARWDGNQWVKLIIDSEHTDHFTSIQLDSLDRPRISYYRELDPNGHYALYLKYAYFDGKTWYIQTVDRRFGTGKYNSLGLDPLGRPYIAYSIVGAGDLGLAYSDGAKWSYGVVDSRSENGNSYVGTENSLVVDSEGDPHIIYEDGTKQTIKYSWRKKGIWHTEVADQRFGREDASDRVSLKLDSHGQPHAAYYDPGLGALKYAVRDEKGWHAEVIDNRGNVGQYPSLYLDEHDTPYVAYHDESEGQLRIAHPESQSAARGALATASKP